MKKKSKVINLILIIVLPVIFTFITYAQTPTNSTEEKDIQNLKDKIATKVAELREKNNRAISGIVQEINLEKDNLNIKTWMGEVFEVKIDSDLTKFYQIKNNQKTEVKSEEIKKDSYIIVSGIIKEKIIEANFIYLDEMFLLGSGSITEVDKEDYFIKVITLDKENYTLDIENFTKQQMLNIKLLNFEKVGFSKIKEGDTVHFVVKKNDDSKEPNRFAAQKILIIPQEYFIK